MKWLMEATGEKGRTWELRGGRRSPGLWEGVYAGQASWRRAQGALKRSLNCRSTNVTFSSCQSLLLTSQEGR